MQKQHIKFINSTLSEYYSDKKYEYRKGDIFGFLTFENFAAERWLGPVCQIINIPGLTTP